MVARRPLSAATPAEILACRAGRRRRRSNFAGCAFFDVQGLPIANSQAPGDHQFGPDLPLDSAEVHQSTGLAPIAPTVEGGLLVGARTGDGFGQGNSKIVAADIVEMMTVQLQAFLVESEGGGPVFHLSPRPTPQMLPVDLARR